MARVVVVAVLSGVLGCNGGHEKPLPPAQQYPAASQSTAVPPTPRLSNEESAASQIPVASLPSFFIKPEGKDGMFTEEQLKLQEQYTKQQVDLKRRLQQMNGEYDPPLRNVNRYGTTNSYFDIESSKQPEPPKPK